MKTLTLINMVCIRPWFSFCIFSGKWRIISNCRYDGWRMGWSKGITIPGFPENGKWKMKAEGFKGCLNKNKVI